MTSSRPSLKRVPGERRASGIIRRHANVDDPIRLLKKKLEAACYGFNRNWRKMFEKMDNDGSGSLDPEEFRLALRRVARVPATHLSDDDIRKIFAAIAIDNGSNMTVELSEFVGFMERKTDSQHTISNSLTDEVAHSMGVANRNNDFVQDGVFEEQRPQHSSTTGVEITKKDGFSQEFVQNAQEGLSETNKLPCTASAQSKPSYQKPNRPEIHRKWNMVQFHITGFGKFNGVKDNPTTHLVNVVRQHSQLFEGRYHHVGKTKVFVVSVEDVDRDMDQLWTGSKLGNMNSNVTNACDFNVKQIWIHLGVHGGAHKIHLEQRAYNDMSFRCPDEAGFQPPMASPIETSLGKDDFLDTSVPVAAICNHQSLTFSTKHSLDPGRFLCNYVFYKTLTRIQKSEDPAAMDAIFVHVPPFHRMALEKQVRVLSHVLHHIASTVCEV